MNHEKTKEVNKDQIKVSVQKTDESLDPQKQKLPEKEEKITPSSFFELLRYSSPKEKAQLLTGTIATTLTGFVWPVFCYIFGRIIDVIDPLATDMDIMVEDASNLCYLLFIIGTLAFLVHVVSRYMF